MKFFKRICYIIIGVVLLAVSLYKLMPDTWRGPVIETWEQVKKEAGEYLGENLPKGQSPSGYMSEIPAWDNSTPYVFLNSDGTVIVPDSWDTTNYGDADTSINTGNYDLNKGDPEFTEEEIAQAQQNGAWIELSELDEKGRTGTAEAYITPEMLPVEERGSIASVKPSGWEQAKYPDCIPDLYLYNRCHQLAYCLTGLNDEERNLFTGTRYLNITGMLPFESMTLDHVRSGGSVLYRATPVFEGSQLTATGLILEGLSVDDGGASVRFRVFIYNEQPGIGIDHASGKSWKL